MKPIKGRVIIDCWDNGGRSIDRYSIAITGMQSARGVPYTYWLGASENPFHPQGFGQHEGEIMTREFFRSRYTHLGHPVGLLDLPPDVQRFIRSELHADPDLIIVRDIMSHVRDAITATPEFEDPDAPVSGAELVEWFSAWRGNAKELLRVLDGGRE